MTHQEFWAPTDVWIDRAATTIAEWVNLREQLTSEGLLP